MTVGSATWAATPPVPESDAPTATSDPEHWQARLETFVGREREMQILRARIDDAMEGKGSLVLVSGEPGIGKTRLLTEAARYAEERGAQALWGRCREGEGAPAFWPWVQVLRHLLQLPDSRPRPIVADDLCAFANNPLPDSRLGPIATRGIPQTGVDYSTAARFQMFDRLATAIKSAASAKPATIIVDDLHDADIDSLALVEFLSADISRTQMVLLASYRSDAVSAATPFDTHILPIVRNCSPHRIELTGLNPPEISALIALHTAWPHPDHELVQSLSQRTAGNPFFIVETCRLAKERLDPQDFEAGIAPTIRTLIRTRLTVISRSCRKFLDVAAVIGTEFDLLTVATILNDCRQTDLDDMVAEGLRHGFVRRTRRNVNHYAFSHSLVREVVYADLPSTVLRQLHMEAAKVLGNSHEVHLALDVIAHHMYLAGNQFDLNETRGVLVRAGRRCLETLAYDKALRHLQRAAEIEQPLDALEEHCSLQLLIGEAQMKAGLWTEARLTFESTLATARHIGSATMLAAAAIGLKGMTRGTLPPDIDAVRALREALAVVPEEHARTRARILTALSTSLYFDRVEAEKLPVLAQQAFENAQKDGDVHVVGEAIEAKILAAYRYDRIEEMLGHCDALQTIASRVGIRDLEFRGRIFKYAGLIQRNDPRSITELEICTQLAEELRHPRYLWQVHLARASLALAQGDLRHASELCHQTRERGKRFHDPTSDQHLLMLRFTEAKIRQQYSSLVGPLEDIVSAAPDYPLPRAGLAFMQAAMGNQSRSRFTLAPITVGGLSAIRPDGFSLVTLCILAETTRFLPSVPWLEELECRLEPYADQLAIAGWGTAIEGSVAHFLALIKVARGDIEGAFVLAEKALSINREASLDLLAARSECLCASLLHQLGRHSEELRLASLAKEFCRTIELRPPMFGARCEEPPHAGSISYSASNCSAAKESQARTSPQAGPNEFARQGEFWHISFAGRAIRMRDTKGIRHLHSLVNHQGQFLLATDLIQMSVGSLASRGPSTSSAGTESLHSKSDLRALAEYRARLRELNIQLEDSQICSDMGFVERLQVEKAELEDFLIRESGLFGRQRNVGSVAEKARINVRNAISNALHRIHASHDLLARHFDCSVKTGRLCCYRPAEETIWQLGPN